MLSWKPVIALEWSRMLAAPIWTVGIRFAGLQIIASFPKSLSRAL